MKRRLTIILLILLILTGLAGLGLHALVRWNWGGPALLGLVEAKINGKVTAGQVSGNPLTGITYKDLVVAGPDGQVVLKTARLELRLSLRSIPEGHLILSSLTFSQASAHLIEVSGHWNIDNLLKPEAPPAAAPGLLKRLEASFLKQIDLPNLEINKGEILVTRDTRPERYRDLMLKANLTFSHASRPEQEIKVKRADLSVTAPQGRLQFSTRLDYQYGLAKINHFALKLAGETILTLQGELCRPASGLSCKASGQWGPLKGGKIQEFWDRWPAAWDLAGKFDYRGTENGGNLNTQGNVGQARFDLQAEFEAAAQPGSFSLKGSLQGLTTGQLKEMQGTRGEKIEGLSPLNARLDLKGTGLPWNPASMAGTLSLSPFQFRKIKVSRLRLTLQGDARSQDFQGLVKGNFGTVSAAARGHLLPLGAGGRELGGGLALRTEKFQPALLGFPEYAGTNLNSSFNGTFRLPPNYAPNQIYLAGDLRADGRVNDEPLQNLQARFTLERERLDIARAEMRLAGGEAAIKGRVSRAEVDLTFSAALAGARHLPVAAGSSFSSLTAIGTIRGAWKAVRINLEAQARQLAFQGITLQSADLKADLSGWPPLAGNLALTGTDLRTQSGAFSRLGLNAQGQGGSWEFHMSATSKKYPRLELSGNADLRRRPLAFQVSRVSWQSQGLSIKNQAPFRVNFLPGWEISPVTFQVDGGTVAVQATARGRELSGRLEVRNLNATLVEPAGYQVAGKLSGGATLSGAPQAPLLTGNFTLAAGQIQEMKITALSATLNYTPETLQISGSMEGPQHSRLTWKGTVPVAFSIIPFRFALGNQGLDLQLQSEKVNLSLLTIITPEIQAAQAPVDLLVTAKGDPHRPELTGSVRWGAGSVQPRLAGLNYRLNPGEARLTGERVEIPAITLESQGTLTVSGNLDLAGNSHLETRLQGFQAMDRGGNQIWLDGDLRLSGPMAHLAAGGQITVPKALLRPTLFSGGLDPDVVLAEQKKAAKEANLRPGPYRNMQIAVTIAGRNILLKDPQGQLYLDAVLKATKKAGGELAMGGTIRGVKGSITVENHPFKVERAVITMPGVPDKPMLVDVRAVHKMRDHEITLVLSVTGTTANPSVSLDSIPPMNSTDALSYMVFGGPAASLNSSQYLALAAQGVGGSLTSQKVGEILGAALPYISKTGSSGPSAGIRKQITKNVSVSYGKKLNDITGQYESQAVIEYKVNQHLSLDSDVSPRNTGADALYNYEW